MTVRAEIVTVRCKRLPQSTQCVTSGRYVRLIVCWYSFFFLMTFPCSLALFATLLSILSPHVGREYCPHGLKGLERVSRFMQNESRNITERFDGAKDVGEMLHFAWQLISHLRFMRTLLDIKTMLTQQGLKIVTQCGVHQREDRTRLTHSGRHILQVDSALV